MFLYLIQHAEAVNKEEDPSRCLSDKGINDIRKVAVNLLKKDVKIDRILHSGKLRSLQTAQVLADYIASDNDLSETDGLSPNDDPGIWSQRISGLSDEVMLVGHLPHLGKLLTLLVSGEEAENFEFVNGIVICLKNAEDGKWSIEWTVKPGMLN